MPTMLPADLLLVQLEAQTASLAGALTARLYDAQPELQLPLAPAGRREFVADSRFLFEHLHQSLAASQPALFGEYAVWRQGILTARGISDLFLVQTLELIPDLLSEFVAPGLGALAQPIIGAALEAIRTCFPTPSHLDSPHPLAPFAQTYLAALLAADRPQAAHAVSEALATGASLEDIYLEIFQRTQREIGRLWQIQRISPAQEHYATAATQFIMAGFYQRALPRAPKARTFVAACVPGELHDTGLRIVADFFELAGWRTHFLGPDVPAADVVDFAFHHDAHLIGLSASLSTRFTQARDAIAHIRAHDPARKCRILCGGSLVESLDDPCRLLGADAVAGDARSAVKTAAALFA
jgi:MerR family transcriptional regulator, light-induced transcriptional regulator